jgi:hypothetical protein
MLLECKRPAAAEDALCVVAILADIAAAALSTANPSNPSTPPPDGCASELFSQVCARCFPEHAAQSSGAVTSFTDIIGVAAADLDELADIRLAFDPSDLPRAPLLTTLLLGAATSSTTMGVADDDDLPPALLAARAGLSLDEVFRLRKRKCDSRGDGGLVGDESSFLPRPRPFTLEAGLCLALLATGAMSATVVPSLKLHLARFPRCFRAAQS